MHDAMPLDASELRSVLALLLAVPGDGRPAGPRQVRDFSDYLTDSGVQWHGLRSGRGRHPSAVFFALLLPGRTAIVMLPNPGELEIDDHAQRALTRAGLTDLTTHGLHYAQLLLEPEAAAKRTLIEDVGFRFLAALRYLERDAVYPWVEPPEPLLADWIRYEPRTHADFVAVVAATYEQSLDCPELTGIRPIEDALEAHKAAGQFDPSLWELALVGGRPAACLLLSRGSRGEGLDLAYMGVVPAYRGRGVGDLLLCRALAQCRAHGARRLTAVVDERNGPARRLYERFGMTTAMRREAYWYRWHEVGV